MISADLQMLTARCPEDVLAAVPLVLGFVPEESVVMLTVGARHPFHARLDLPGTGGERRSAAEALLRPCLRHDVPRVLFVLYAGDAALARSCARVLVRTFAGHGIHVVGVLRSDGVRWFVVPLGRSDPEGPGTPYDVAGHLFTAQAVVSGRVTRASRAELAATVAADPEGAAQVARAVASLEAVPDPDESDLDPWAWVREAAERLVEDGGPPPDPAASARLLVALREPAARDTVLDGVDRRAALGLLAAWSALVRVAPPGVVAPAASVLAFLAWLAGDGALAWCALARAEEGDPPCSLADRVAEALEQAVPPARWGDW